MGFIDANVFMYAAGVEHPHKKPSIAFLERIARTKSAHAYCISVEILQEILHRYHAINKTALGFEIVDIILNLGLTIYSVELEDIMLTKVILTEAPRLHARDALHLAVAERHGVRKMITFDKCLSEYTNSTCVIPSE